jgi:hypothetical protein
MSDTQTSRNRGTHLLCVEFFSLDGAGSDHLFGQALQIGLTAKMEAKALHLTKQPPLLMSQLGQKGQQTRLVPSEVGPVFVLMDIAHGFILRNFAENKGRNLRKSSFSVFLRRIIHLFAAKSPKESVPRI